MEPLNHPPLDSTALPLVESTGNGLMSRQELMALLRKHDITPTHPRLLIAELLFSKHEHWSAEKLFAKLNQPHHQASMATVYNTLNLLVHKKLLREVIVDPVRVFYDSNLSAHYHLYNVDTGELSDIGVEELVIEQFPSMPKDMVTQSIDIIVRVRPKHKAETIPA